jgi:hypothetical protein
MLHVQLGALYCQRETAFPSVTVINLAVTLAFGEGSPFWSSWNGYHQLLDVGHKALSSLVIFN